MTGSHSTTGVTLLRESIHYGSHSTTGVNLLRESLYYGSQSTMWQRPGERWNRHIGCTCGRNLGCWRWGSSKIVVLRIKFYSNTANCRKSNTRMPAFRIAVWPHGTETPQKSSLKLYTISCCKSGCACQRNRALNGSSNRFFAATETSYTQLFSEEHILLLFVKLFFQNKLCVQCLYAVQTHVPVTCTVLSLFYVIFYGCNFLVKPIN